MPRIPARSLRATLLATALLAAVAVPGTAAAAPYPPRSRFCSIYSYALTANGKGGVIGANGTITLCRDGVTNAGSFTQLGQGIGTVRFETFPQKTFGTNRLFQDAGGPVDTGFVQKGAYTSARITVCTVGAPADECVHGDYRNRFVRAPGRP